MLIEDIRTAKRKVNAVDPATSAIHSFQSLKHYFKKHGFEHVQNGGTDVFIAPNQKYVVKMVRRDSPSLEYAKFVKQNRNKHYPTIYGIKELDEVHATHRGRDDKNYIVIQERLYHLPREIEYAVDKYLLPISEEIERRYDSYDEFLNSIRNNAAKSHGDHARSFFPKSFLDAMVQMGDVFDKYFSDLHGQNVMQRQNGTLVITDPVA